MARFVYNPSDKTRHKTALGKMSRKDAQIFWRNIRKRDELIKSGEYDKAEHYRRMHKNLVKEV